MKRLARAEELWLGMTSGAIISTGEFSWTESSDCLSVWNLQLHGIVPVTSSRTPTGSCAFWYWWLWINYWSLSTATFCLTYFWMPLLCIVLSSDPVRPGVLLSGLSGAVVLPGKRDVVKENPQVEQECGRILAPWEMQCGGEGCSASEWMGGCPLTSGDLKWLVRAHTEVLELRDRTGLSSYLAGRGEHADKSPTSLFSLSLLQAGLCCGFPQCIPPLLLCLCSFLQLFGLSLLIMAPIRSTRGGDIWAFHAVLLSNGPQLVVLLSLHSSVCGGVHCPAYTQWMIYHLLSVGLCTVSRDNVFFHLVPSWWNTLPYGFHMWFS